MVHYWSSNFTFFQWTSAQMWLTRFEKQQTNSCQDGIFNRKECVYPPPPPQLPMWPRCVFHIESCRCSLVNVLQAGTKTEKLSQKNTVLLHEMSAFKGILRGLLSWLTGVNTYQSQLLYLPPACPSSAPPQAYTPLTKPVGVCTGKYGTLVCLQLEGSVINTSALPLSADLSEIKSAPDKMMTNPRPVSLFPKAHLCRGLCISEVPISTWIKLTQAGAVKHGNLIPLNPQCQRHLAVTTPRH